MANRKPLVVVTGTTRQIADADALAVNGGLDRTTSGALQIGGTGAETSVQVGSTSVPTTVAGDLTVVGSLTAQGANTLALVLALKTNTFMP